MTRYGFRYGFKSIEEIAKTIYKNEVEVIDFTMDTREDIIHQPEGWYGVSIKDLFSNPVLVIGYYGGGLGEYVNLDYGNDEYNISVITETLVNYISEFIPKATKDTEIAVDIDQWED